jgi:phage/plasmid-associated DNA primase
VDNIEYLICCEITKGLDEEHASLLGGDDSESIQDVIKFYSKKDSMAKQIEKFAKVVLVDEDFHLRLDRTPNYLAFKNGMLDLTSKTFRRGLCQSDYLTRTIPYDYEKCDETDKATLKQDLMKITNNKQEHFDYIFSVLGYSFLGKAHLEQVYWFFLGMGSNGKSLLLEVLKALFPNYVTKSNAKIWWRRIIQPSISFLLTYMA